MKFLKNIWLWFGRIFYLLIIGTIRPIGILLFVVLLNGDGVQKQISAGKQSDEKMYYAGKNGKVLPD